MAKPQVAPPQTAKDRIRARTIGSNKTRRWEAIEIDLGDGPETVVLKAPSIAGDEAAQEAAGMTFHPGADGTARSTIAHPLRFAVEMVILCCHAPTFGPSGEIAGPGEAIFTQLDRSALMEEGMTGWLKDLSDKVNEFNKVKPKAIAKNSEATPSAPSASA